MYLDKRYHLIVAFCICWGLICLPTESMADWIPYVRATISNEYDSNIFLDPQRKDYEGKSAGDYRLTVTPTIGLRNETEHQQFSGEYSPVFNYFHEHSDQNYLGHNLSLDYTRAITQHLSFFVTEGLIYSEEPEELSYTDYVDRDPNARMDTRSSHLDTTTAAGFTYQFGPEDALTLTYYDARINYTNSSDGPEGEGYGDNDDSVAYGPELELTYWFSQRHGLGLTYSWRRYDYEYEYSRKTQDIGLVYTYRYSPHMTIDLDYSIEFVQEYGPEGFDYHIHRLTAGFEKAFSSSWTLHASAGFWSRSNIDENGAMDYVGYDPDSEDSGFMGSLGLDYTWNHFHTTLSMEAGTRTAFNDYENRGFTEYRSISLSTSYDLSDRLGLYASAGYYHDLTPEMESGHDDRTETYRFSAGCNYLILPWLTSTLEYQYNESSETEIDDRPAGYEQHIIMFNLTASYEWL